MSAIEERTVLEAVRAADQTGLAERLSMKFGGVLIALPAATADAALLSMLVDWGVVGARIVSDPDAQTLAGTRLGGDAWALVVPVRYAGQLQAVFLNRGWVAAPTMNDSTEAWWVFPRHCVRISRTYERHLRRALDIVTPEVMTDGGVPAPWVAAEAPTAELGGERNREADVEFVPAGAPHGPLPATPEGVLEPDDDQSIRSAFRRLCARAGVGDVPLDIARTGVTRDGFVSGRVWLSHRRAERIRVEIGPNSDAAEIWATLLHETAHGLELKGDHGKRFKKALVGLAEGQFGVGYFAVPRRAISQAHATVDAWVAVGVRAALNGAQPPVEESGDEGQLAKVVSRIQKLRRLARSQLGRPEGRAACAKANDLLVKWDLGAYSVRLSEGIDDQMCDRWVNIGKRSVWRRQLAFHVGEYCGVFSLSRKSRGWMHFFGRYVDVVTAEWFYEIWEAHIVRSAKAHIKLYKASGGLQNTRSERTDFCDSAVMALAVKLGKLQESQPEDGDQALSVRQAQAEAFAGEQFELRGLRWGAGSGKRVRVNVAGVRAGQNAPMGRGVGASARVRGLIES